jgi:hypothetical protein
MMRNRPALLAVVVSLAGCTAAMAQLITLPSDYGNAAGCEYLATGKVDGDTLQFLTERELGGYGGGCSFAIAGADIGDTILVHGICSHEGEETLTSESFIIPPPYEDCHIEILRANGELWGELEPCP